MISLVGAKHTKKWHTRKLHAPSTRPNETNTISVQKKIVVTLSQELKELKNIYLQTDLHDYNSLNQPKKDKKIIHTHTRRSASMIT